MNNPYPIRPITEAEFDAFHTVDEHAFHGSPISERARSGVLSRFEFDRSLAAFDGSVPVGITAIFSFQMSVPGAMIPVAGVSWVGVLPSHRRRGIMHSLMHRQLADVRERGEAIAGLWASESGIYGRYGYGRASWAAHFTFRRGEGALAREAPADPALRLRLAEPEASRNELAKVYETVLPTRPGFFARNEPWWNRVLEDPADERKGASPLHCVLAEDDSGPRGYALYSGLARWEDETFLDDSVLNIRELVTADPAASAALWANLLSRDLTNEFRAQLRPADDPVLFQLANPRRARPQVSDGLWVRIIDVAAALTQRSYSCPVDAIIEVTDDVFGDNSGRWRLVSGGVADRSAASCERTIDPPDIALGIRELGAAYLGGTRLGSLAAAGLVNELRPGTLAPLSAALSWDPSPWCPMIF